MKRSRIRGRETREEDVGISRQEMMKAMGLGAFGRERFEDISKTEYMEFSNRSDWIRKNRREESRKTFWFLV